MATEEQIKFYDDFLPHFEEQVNNPRNVGFRQFTRAALRSRPVLNTPNAKVLDIGCAYGYNSEYLHREFPGCEIYGADISPRCIEEANRRFPHGFWYCGDITEDKLAFKDIRLILMSDVLEHIPKDRHGILFKKIEEMTVPGAVLVLSVPVFEADTEKTPQPVEEKVYVHEILTLLFECSFRIVDYVDRAFPYQRFMVERD